MEVSEGIQAVNGSFPAVLERLDIITDEIKCLKSHENSTLVFADNQSYCNATWDGLSCWPPIGAGSLATINCFYEFNGVLYNTLDNASRYCTENASWASKSDYTRCKPIFEEENHLKSISNRKVNENTLPYIYRDVWSIRLAAGNYENNISLKCFRVRESSGNITPDVLWDIKDAGTIYYVGYSLSLLALVAALYIFLHFKNLNCLRNNIHTNLLTTYFFLDLTWIVTATLQSLPPMENSAVLLNVSCILIIILTYLMVTNFFWMFVEGLYLYILAVKTFSIEVVRMPVYAFIGWGLPALIVMTWAIAKAYYAPSPNDPLLDDCIWQTKDYMDYIFICPIILVLVVNVFFMCKIMWVLITKLGVASSAESKQYRKAAKALLVLIPLLGITYVLVIVTPTHRTARVVVSYLQAVLLSTQGFTVAILYCFLNGEVQKSVHHVWRRWSTRRTVHGSQRCSVSYRSAQNGRDNIKLYRTTRGNENRGSSASFTTCATNAPSNSNLPSSCNRSKSQRLEHVELNKCGNHTEL